MTADLDNVGHIQVRSVMLHVGYEHEREALISIAAGEQKHWTLPEWEEMLRKLDNCRDTVEDWLSFRSFLES